MFFTREDILKIQKALLQLGVKDSELPNTESVTYNDILSIVQDGKNKKIKIKDFFNQISLWKKESFINITDTYDKYYITLTEAINNVPILQRKDGLVITFQDSSGIWKIYQFRGNITEFLEKDKWFDLSDYRNYITESLLPDEEDITALTPDKNGNSFLALKDRIYDPAIFNGKGYKFVRKNIINVELATIKISVTNPTTLEGDIYFNINNKGTKVHLSPSIHNTTKLVAEAIKDTLTTAYTDYEVTIVNSIITLIHRYSEKVSPTTFEMYNTGVKVTVEDSTIIEERNVITQKDISEEDTIYEIRYDFDLDGKTITIPNNCVLYFTSGKFYNGSINMDNTIVSTLYEDILSEVNINGNYYNIQKHIKDHQSQLDDKQSQIDDKQQQITANDEDISLLQTRSTQMEETIKGIAATGGASQATAVTYDNENSKLTAINIQSAVDEVVDKTVIKDEEGTLVETPFRYIQNEEFIFAKVDNEDKLLFGIQWDGTPKFGKTSAVEDRLQSQVTLLAERVATIMGDEDTTNVIDTMNELKKFFAEIENTETLTSILANLDNVAKNLDKTTIKDEKGNVQDTPFRVIENEEFIKAIVDAEDKVLFGFYRATGKPYYPLNEMYHVIQNKEYFAAWVTTDNKVVLGIRRDGEIIGEIHAVNALKKVISQLQSDLALLQEKVGAIDTNLKELLDVFSLQESPEYLAVEKDAEGKVLSATYNDGSHYSHNLKSETIDGKVDKEKGKSLIDSGFADNSSSFEDIEQRMSMELDADENIVSMRDATGIKREKVGFDSPKYFQNGSQKEWIDKEEVVPFINGTDQEIKLSVLDGVADHNTPNLIVASDIQKTFNDGTTSFTPPNAGYEMSNRIECSAGDYFTRTGTATGMIIVTDVHDKNGKRLFASNGSTLGSTFQVPANLTWVKYIRMAVDAEAAKAGDVIICKGKKAYGGEQKGKFLTIDDLKIQPSNMSKDARFLKTSNGDYYELYIDESDFSVKAKKVDPSVIVDLPSDFPVYTISGDFSKHFKSIVSMADLYITEQNANGVTALQKTGANVYYYAEFRKEKASNGETRYVVVYPYVNYVGQKGEIGLTIYDKNFNVIDTNIKIGNVTFDAHDFIYLDDNHIIAVGISGSKRMTLQNGTETIDRISNDWSIFEIKKVNGTWKELASFHMNDYPKLLTDGVNKGNQQIRNHWNTIQLDYDGNLIMNMRDMNCFWKIKRTVDSQGNVIIGSKTKDYEEAIIGRVGGVYNSGYIDSKRILDEDFSFTDVPSDLESRSSDEPPLWKFYHEHDTTYWGKKNIGGKEYPTYLIFDNNMWTGSSPVSNYDDLNPRNNYKNNPTASNEGRFVESKSDNGGNYDTRMVSRVVQISIDWDNHLVKDHRVYIIPKKYSSTRSSCQMLTEGLLLISWADSNECGLYDFNDEQTQINGKQYSNGKELFHMNKSSYRVHGYID